MMNVVDYPSIIDIYDRSSFLVFSSGDWARAMEPLVSPFTAS